MHSTKHKLLSTKESYIHCIVSLMPATVQCCWRWHDEGVLLQNWAEMETEYRQVQEECQDLHSLLQQRDNELCTLNQSLLDLTVRMKVHSSVLIIASANVTVIS